MQYHVTPVNDLKPHIESVDCDCNPSIIEGVVDTVVHNAYDGREGVELANEILNDGIH